MSTKFSGKIELFFPNKKPPMQMPTNKFKRWRVIEVHIEKIKNVAQMSEPIKVKVKYVQGHFYIVYFGIYRWCLAAIPIFDILIGFWSRMAEPQCRKFPFCECCLSLLPPTDTFKILRTAKSNDLAFGGFVKIWLKSVGQILWYIAEKDLRYYIYSQ